MNEGLPSESAETSNYRSLLRPLSEEGVVSREKAGPRYSYLARDMEKELLVYGTTHTYNPDKYTDVVSALDSFKPQIVFVEGGTWNIEGKNAEQIMRDKGEQAYVSYLAKEKGIAVETWDLTGIKHYETALKENSPDAVLGWLVGSRIGGFYDSGKPRNMVNFLGNLGPRPRAFAEKYALDLSPENIDRVVRKYTGHSIEEMSLQEADSLFDPFADTEGGKVARDTIEERDGHAVDVLAEAKLKYDRVFVTCGRNHAIRWEPAIAAMYGKTESI